MSRVLRRTCSLVAALATVLSGVLAVVALGSPPAGAVSAFGVQRLIVVPVRHQGTVCPTAPMTPSNVPQCPRYTAAQWQTIFQRELDAWFRAESYNQASIQVHVLVDPATADGWWPAPHTPDEYHTKNAFTDQGSIGRDAAEVVMAEALAKGVVSNSELDQTHRFIMMDNYHGRGGTTNGLGSTITYHPSGHAFVTTTSLIPEAPNDSETLSLAEHELTHQLGAPDLYGIPCPWAIPGDPVRDHRSVGEADCVGPWDHMALDDWAFAGYGSYTRQRLRYLNPGSSSQVVEVGKTFSGTVSLDPVERPAGGALVLRVPNDIAGSWIKKIFGNPGPYKGFMVECRRRIVNDTRLPAEGALVTYYDPARAAYAPIKVTRGAGSFGVSTSSLSTPGASYSNSVFGVKFTYVGPSASGGCVVDVNKTRKVYPHYVPIGGQLAEVLQSAPAFGGSQPFAGFAGTGVMVAGGSGTPRLARADARKRHTVQPLARGRRASITFGYANGGTKVAQGGTATVRVNDPYAVNVCGKPGKGRVVAKVPLKRLKPGKSATRTVSFVPRSSGPIGVSVSISKSGKGAALAGAEETGTVAFTTASSNKSKAKAGRTTVRVKSSKKGCAGPVDVELVPLVQPDGWTFTTKGGDQPLAPGKSEKITLMATPPVGAKPMATQVPVAIQVGEAHHPGGLEVPYGRAAGDLQLIGGLDVLLRVGKPGGKLPSFVLAQPASAPPAATYPGAPPTPVGSTLSLTCPSSADFAVTVPGVLAPTTTGAVVTLTYEQNIDHEIVTHQVVTDVNGQFSDSFVAPRAGWTVHASWAGDGAHLPAVSNACGFAIPIV